MPIHIMTMDDYPAVYSLWTSAEGVGPRALNDSDDLPEGIARFLARNPRTCFVADKDGVVAGAILSGHDGRRGFICHTAVSPAFQLGQSPGQGRLDGTGRRGHP